MFRVSGHFRAKVTEMKKIQFFNESNSRDSKNEQKNTEDLAFSFPMISGNFDKFPKIIISQVFSENRLQSLVHIGFLYHSTALVVVNSKSSMYLYLAKKCGFGKRIVTKISKINFKPKS